MSTVAYQIKNIPIDMFISSIPTNVVRIPNVYQLPAWIPGPIELGIMRFVINSELLSKTNATSNWAQRYVATEATATLAKADSIKYPVVTKIIARAIFNTLYTTPIIFRSAGSIVPSAIATKKLLIANVDAPIPSEIPADCRIIATTSINSITL